MAVGLDQLAPILADIGCADPVGLVEMQAAASATYRVDLSDGARVVLKTYAPLFFDLPANKRYAAEVLVGIDLAVTRYLLVDFSRTRLPFGFAITTYLPGRTVTSFLGEPDVNDLFVEMGEVLRRLHTVRLPRYGRFGAGGPIGPATTHQEWLAEQGGTFARFREFGGDAGLADRLQDGFERRKGALSQGSGPVFAHNDFNPANLLAERIDRRLRVTAVIDFGSAIASDATSDLAKTLFVCEHDAPGSSPAIRSGYGPIDQSNPDTVLWLYLLLHRATMWWWLRHVGAIADGEHHPLIDDLQAMADAPLAG